MLDSRVSDRHISNSLRGACFKIVGAIGAPTRVHLAAERQRRHLSDQLADHAAVALAADALPSSKRPPDVSPPGDREEESADVYI